MKILVASDKFKGSLTAPEACAAIAAGLREGLGATEAEIRSFRSRTAETASPKPSSPPAAVAGSNAK